MNPLPARRRRRRRRWGGRRLAPSRPRSRACGVGEPDGADLRVGEGDPGDDVGGWPGRRRPGRGSRRRRCGPGTSPMWVSSARPLQSPTAYSQPPATPAARSRSSTSIGRPGSSPTGLEAEVAVFGRRPTATRISSASTTRAVVEVARTGPSPAGRSTAVIRTPVMTAMPSASSAARTSSPAKGSSRARSRSMASTHGHLVAAEATDGLGHLDADRAAAEHEQAAGDVLGGGDVAVVPGAGLGQPGDRGNGRRWCRWRSRRPAGRSRRAGRRRRRRSTVDGPLAGQAAAPRTSVDPAVGRATAAGRCRPSCR